MSRALDQNRVKLTTIREQPEIYVSTVFLGIDHNFGDGPPILYETMVFGLEDEYQCRYETRVEAESGHDRTVKMVLGLVESRDKE